MVLVVPEEPNDLCLRVFLHVEQVQWYFSYQMANMREDRIQLFGERNFDLVSVLLFGFFLKGKQEDHHVRRLLGKKNACIKGNCWNG